MVPFFRGAVRARFKGPEVCQSARCTRNAECKHSWAGRIPEVATQERGNHNSDGDRLSRWRNGFLTLCLYTVGVVRYLDGLVHFILREHELIFRDFIIMTANYGDLINAILNSY